MTPIPDPILVFFGSLQREDYAAARACLADRFSFVGWFDTFDSADAYIDAAKTVRGFTRGIDVRHVFADGDDTAIFYDTHTIHGDVAPVAAWITLEGGRIARIRVICDSRPFAAMWEKP